MLSPGSIGSLNGVGIDRICCVSCGWHHRSLARAPTMGHLPVLQMPCRDVQQLGCNMAGTIFTPQLRAKTQHRDSQLGALGSQRLEQAAGYLIFLLNPSPKLSHLIQTVSKSPLKSTGCSTAPSRESPSAPGMATQIATKGPLHKARMTALGFRCTSTGGSLIFLWPKAA